MTFSQTDWGRTSETMGTYFRNNGNVLPKQWGRTSATMGTYFSNNGDELELCPKEVGRLSHWQKSHTP